MGCGATGVKRRSWSSLGNDDLEGAKALTEVPGTPEPAQASEEASLCVFPGCGKPTWNRQPGTYCSLECQEEDQPRVRHSVTVAVPATCSRPGCSKPSWNGQPHEYCSPPCRDAQAQDEALAAAQAAATPTCLRPGCGKPTWNGLPNNYCSKFCRSSPVCMRPGCGKPTWNGKPNEYCSKGCRMGVVAVAPVLAADRGAATLAPAASDASLSAFTGPVCLRVGCGKPTWNGLPGEFCSRSCKVGRPLEPGLLDVHKLEKVSDAGVLEEFQELLRATHKKQGNWTRDRGCSKHGRNNCPDACIMANNAPVPASYKLVSVEHNHNTALWRQYVQARSSIQKDCTSRPAYKLEDVASSRPPFDALGKSLGVEELAKNCNEWFLFHGATREACEGICGRGFQIGLAGTGATFKVGGRPKRPLYGWGAYFAEMFTKSDEYAREVRKGHFSMLVCRVVGGVPLVVTEDTIKEQVLKDEVVYGSHHSVLGDRMQKLGKPYREVVAYNSEQIFPEFIVTYERL